MPRPPQTVSRSTPSFRAASSRLAPSSNSPRLPDGLKTIRCEPKPLAPRPATPFAPTGARLALGRGLAIGANPGAAIGVVAHHDIGAEDRLPVFRMQRV